MHREPPTDHPVWLRDMARWLQNSVIVCWGHLLLRLKDIPLTYSHKKHVYTQEMHLSKYMQVDATKMLVGLPIGTFSVTLF